MRLCARSSGTVTIGSYWEKEPMKKIFILLMALCMVPVASAQTDDDMNHGSFGVFVNYTRLQHADLNFLGIGGRLGFNVHPNVQLEGEMAYDFERSRDDRVTFGGTTNTVRSDLRMLHGMFGPKFQTNGPVRVFGTVKGGFLNFSLQQTNVPAGFVGAVGNVPNGDTNGVLYFGGGLEAYANWFGVRIELGDEIYFEDGANHNFRLTIGPQFRW